MLHSKYLLLAISLTCTAGDVCQEPGLALVADGAPVDHLMLTEATEVMLLGEGECDVMVSYLAVGGGGSSFGAGGGSGGVTFGQVSWPAGGFPWCHGFSSISFPGSVLSIAIGQGRGFEEEVPGGATVLDDELFLVAAGGGGGGYGKGGDGYSGGGG